MSRNWGGQNCRRKEQRSISLLLASLLVQTWKFTMKLYPFHRFNTDIRKKDRPPPYRYLWFFEV